jgi:hypothetical protein
VARPANKPCPAAAAASTAAAGLRTWRQSDQLQAASVKRARQQQTLEGRCTKQQRLLGSSDA